MEFESGKLPQPLESMDEELKWQLIKMEFECGKLSVAAIGRLYGVTDNAIRKRAMRGNPPWERKLMHTLEEEARMRLLQEEEFQPKTDEERLALLAERQKLVIVSHRGDINKVRTAANTMLNRLNAMLNGEDIEGPFMGDKESPADMLKKVSDALRYVIPLERQAFGIKEELPQESAKTQTGVVFLPPKAQNTPEGVTEPVSEGSENG